MSQSTGAPSLFDDGQIGTGGNNNSQSQAKLQAINLIDLLHDGFYLVFLIRNQYVPADAQQFREKILNLLNQFEQQAKKLQFSADDIHDAKYAFCALIDETIVTQQDPSYFNLQNAWLISPLQLSLFGSQLAGYRFFEILEQLRSRGKERLAALEVFHYCLLLGFQGKYRIESIESLNHLVSRVGDEIDYLKGKKSCVFAVLGNSRSNTKYYSSRSTFLLDFDLSIDFCITYLCGFKIYAEQSK